MHRNECFHGDAHSIIVSPRSMEELMASPRSRYAHSVLYIGHRSPAAFWGSLISINSVLLRITSPIPVIFNKRRFLSQGPTWIESWPEVEENWRPALQTLEGHSDESYAETGAPQQTLEGHSNFVSAVALSPNERRLASASYDGTVSLWDAKTGALQRTFRGLYNSVNIMTFSPSGQHLITNLGSINLRTPLSGPN
jgi:WD40 repeat protein